MLHSKKRLYNGRGITFVDLTEFKMPVFKIWTDDRKVKKSVVASTVQELVKKGKKPYIYIININI